jgi:hypothetical protein
MADDRDEWKLEQRSFDTIPQSVLGVLALRSSLPRYGMNCIHEPSEAR